MQVRLQKKTPTQFAVKWKIEQGEKVGKSQGQSRVSCDDGTKLNSNSPSACKFEFLCKILMMLG